VIAADPKLKAADLFCGAGGFTQGAVETGRVDVALAINHWRTAVYSHQANHPETHHLCARIDDVHPRHDPVVGPMDLDLLLASPECTHHSIARGGQPVCDQKRATPWHVVIWAEAKLPKWIVVENVREFRDWGPVNGKGRTIKSRKGEIFRQWIKSLESIGYDVDHQLLNAADFGAATKRVRLFIVGRRRDVGHGDIPWPDPTHSKEQWRPAWSIIDWTRPCPSIFARKRPLAENTLRRIEAGLRKFCGPDVADPFLVYLRGTGTANSVYEPTPTITAGGTHLGVAQPFQFKAMGRNPGATKPVTDPLPTIVAARENHAVVVPFITKYNGQGDDQRNHSVDEPLRTLDTSNRFGVVAPYLVDVNHGGQDARCRDPRAPLTTITTKRGQAQVQAFLTKYYGTGGATSVHDPVDTVTTKSRFGLALVETMRELGISDIGYRMLDNTELARAQGFPDEYELWGTKAEVTRQIGNSVPPALSRALCDVAADQLLARG